MTFLKTSHDGEIFLDHRASPGIPGWKATVLGLPVELVGEGKQMTAPALGCPHCGTPQMLNPWRRRERANCYQCNRYICDICDAIRHEPGYIHRTIEEIASMVHSGKWRMTGSMSRPVMVPVEG